MLDLTNPAAVAWMQDIIINQSVQEGHSSGWMCDFGEYLPFDAVLYSVSLLLICVCLFPAYVCAVYCEQLSFINP